MSKERTSKKLDVYANEKFIQTLVNRNIVCGIASEEEDDFISINSSDNKHQNKYVVLMDPLDGSSNIDVNVSVGTIFSIYRRVTPVGTPVKLQDFLQKGNEQVAAGYIIYGTSTMLVYTTGDGVNGFTLNPAIGTFYLSHPQIKFPNEGTIYSVNEGNYIHFPQGIKNYIKYCQMEENNRPYTSRYIGSLVSDFHRNMIKGGIYLYPTSTKNPQGKLRLLYECNPMAFLAEQASGKASDVAFDNVLLIGDGDKVTVGAPAIGGAQVGAKVLKHLKGDKVIVFKKKRRKGYRVKNGHRQSLTEIVIENIVAKGAKPAKAEKAAPAKKETKKVEPKAVAPKAEAKKEAPKAKPAAVKAAASEDLSSMTVAQLKEIAKAKGITGLSGMKKADLIAALS